MITERIHRSFWSVYGKIVWDRDIPPIKMKVIQNVVDTLTKQRAAQCECVLDAGCGTGHYAIALAEAGFHVTGIDYSDGMLACATSKVTTELAGRLSFQQIDMNQSLPFEDASFHHVISISTLWTVTDPDFTLKEMMRILKPGGTIIVVQVPRPATSFRKAVSKRFKQLDKKTLMTCVLVAAKVFLERTRATKYWTPEELLALLISCKKLKISYVDHGPPILIVGTKIPDVPPIDSGP